MKKCDEPLLTSGLRFVCGRVDIYLQLLQLQPELNLSGILAACRVRLAMDGIVMYIRGCHIFLKAW